MYSSSLINLQLPLWPHECPLLWPVHLPENIPSNALCDRHCASRTPQGDRDESCRRQTRRPMLLNLLTARRGLMADCFAFTPTTSAFRTVRSRPWRIGCTGCGRSMILWGVQSWRAPSRKDAHREPGRDVQARLSSRPGREPLPDGQRSPASNDWLCVDRTVCGDA